jgi:hypothetical protein
MISEDDVFVGEPLPFINYFSVPNEESDLESKDKKNLSENIIDWINKFYAQ